MPFEFKADSDLPEVIHVSVRRFDDPRGWFAETFRQNEFLEAGMPNPFVQDNHSMSGPAGTIRGLHLQLAPHEQGKLVRCLKGRIFDVAVDLRRDSPRYGRYTSVVLSAEAGNQIYIPRGFAHGFCTLEDQCEVSYKTDAYYEAQHEAGIAFDDDTIGISWPFPAGQLTLSDRDAALPDLRNFERRMSQGVEQP